MTTDSRTSTTADLDYGIPPTGHRLPAAAHIGRVRLQVANLERSLGYYQEVLGFQVLERSEGRATLAAHGTAEGDDTPLVELHELVGAAPVPRQGRLGLFHFAILLPDRAALGRFVAHLAEIGARAGASDHLVSEALYLYDPDGLGIEVYADRPRSTWKQEGRQLLMDTLPLDLEDLVRAAGGQPWAGMPAGTVIGHVHLHVGNIPAADAFFHQALGLDRMVWSYSGALFLAAGGYHHHLGVNIWAGAGAPRPKADDARLLEWEIVVPRPEDAEAAARSLQAAGFEAASTEQGWTALDPWGTALRIRS